ncbi:MAG: hypothetical protein M1830_004462, partial [Pleopsidium flavum]
FVFVSGFCLVFPSLVKGDPVISFVLEVSLRFVVGLEPYIVSAGYTRDTVGIADALDDLPPRRPVLPQGNPDITKIAVRVCKDTTRNKMYVKEKILPKSRVGSKAYAAIHDKKEKTKGKKKGPKNMRYNLISELPEFAEV